MRRKQYILILVLLSTAMVFSGCAIKKINEKENNQPVLQEEEREKNDTKDEEKKDNVEVREEIISTIDTTNWQIYRDKEHGFEFKYPKNWIYEISDSGFVQFKDINNTVYYEGSEIYLVGISVVKSQNDFNIENWKELKVKRKGSVRNIKIGNLSGVEASDYLSVDVVIDKDEKRYKLTKPNVESPNINDIFYGLLNSWKFID